MKKEPAFPVLHNGSTLPSGSGLTMRDYFAAKAMAAMFANDNWSHSSRDEIATDAYSQAEAMLKARAA